MTNLLVANNNLSTMNSCLPFMPFTIKFFKHTDILNPVSLQA
jgi:hypothetical protein